MLNYNAGKLLETVRMYQSVLSMKAQLEHFQEAGDYLTNTSSTIQSLQSLINELEQKINGRVP